MPAEAEFGEYRITEVWAETAPGWHSTQIIVRLKGPHHGTEPRVTIVAPKNIRYVSNWSGLNGPPHEVWKVSEALPEVLKIRGDKIIELRCQHE